jgi:putative copper resistance protein D
VTTLLDIFGFLSVLLRGLTLAFEALTVGGVIFLVVIVRRFGGEMAGRTVRLLTWWSLLLAVTLICSVAANSAILVGSTGLIWTEVAGAGFCIGGAIMVAGAIGIALLANCTSGRIPLLVLSALILAGSVMTSHSIARMEHRWPLVGLTLAHHMGSAAWIGGLPYLLAALSRAPDRFTATAVARRFSRMAMVSAPILVAAGAALAWAYVGTAAAMIGTTYGIMLLSKVMLMAVLLFLGMQNWQIVRALEASSVRLPLLQRFAEVEIGVGLTVLLTAASLTSTPPAIDVQGDAARAGEIAQRMKPRWPRLRTPTVDQLSPATPLRLPEDSIRPGSFVPGQLAQPSTSADIAWSEYNHHWAGLILLVLSILAILARRWSWARNWPLVFLGLAIFVLIRADSENWPLGPRGFWESFQVAEVAQHRLFVVLIVFFAIFEWAVQKGRIAPHRAGLVFPLVCASGGALLLTHSHSLGGAKEEFFAELSHVSLAIMAILAGWSRWLEVRLPSGGTKLVAWVWPVCFLMIGVVLICYRES